MANRLHCRSFDPIPAARAPPPDHPVTNLGRRTARTSVALPYPGRTPTPAHPNWCRRPRSVVGAAHRGQISEPFRRAAAPLSSSIRSRPRDAHLPGRGRTYCGRGPSAQVTSELAASPTGSSGSTPVLRRSSEVQSDPDRSCQCAAGSRRGCRGLDRGAAARSRHRRSSPCRVGLPQRDRRHRLVAGR